MRWGVLFCAVTVAACSGPEDDRPVTYHQDVAPLIARRCLGCHVEGGIAPFSLASYAAAREEAVAIKQATASRTMPPWGVDGSGACNTFVDSRWLSDAEVTTIDRWVTAGMEEGDAALAAGPQQPAQEISVSSTLDMGVEYTPDAALTDDYRCFIVDPQITRDQFLTAYQVVPGNARIVHHVILYTVDDATAETQAAAFDGRDPGLGYQCFGGSLLSPQSSRPIAGWAPGTGPTRYPEATGIRLFAGRVVVMQVHYNTRAGAMLADRTRVHLELVDGVDKPAQILGVADLGLIAQPGQELLYTEPITLQVPGIGGFVRGVYPHMHTLGRRLSAEILHTDNSKKCLTEVPHWDFQWQQFYFLEEPLYVLSSDRITLRCAFDTRTRDRPVHWGEGTEDEMCLLGLYVTLN